MKKPLLCIAAATAIGLAALAGETDVARIGTQYYPSLAAAIEAVGDGGTIYMVADVAAANGISVPSGKNFTVDFCSHSYLVEKPGAGSAKTKTQAFQLLKNSTIVFKNGTIGCTVANKDFTWGSSDTTKGVAMVIQNYANLTLDNMTIDGANIAHNGDNKRYVVSNNSGAVAFNDTTIIALDGDVAFDTSKYDDKGTYALPTVAVTGESSSIQGDVELSGGNLTLTAGALTGELVDAGIGAGVITKSEDFEATAPTGYVWGASGDGRYVLTKLPAATVVEIKPTPEDLDRAYKFSVPESDMGRGSENPLGEWSVDFEVSFDKDIEADTVKLAGQYTAYSPDWIGFNLSAMEAGGEPLKLLAGLGFTVTYADLCNVVTNFNCGFKNLSGNVGTKITVNLVMTNGDTDERYVISSTTADLVPVTIDPGTGPVSENPPTITNVAEGVYAVEVTTNATTSVKVNNLGDATLAVPAQIDTVIGIADADKIVVYATATNETTAAETIMITDAFTVTVTGGTATIALKPEAKIDITIGGATEKIAVTPEFSTATDAVKPLVVGDTSVDVGVKTIPGLKYQIVKSTEPTFPDDAEKTKKIGSPIAAKGTRLALAAAKGDDPAAFYKVEVTK